MPFYEYQCSACGHRLEALQKISDDPLVDCPNCGAQGLKKLISAAAFRLKGTGWYETDFKNNGKKEEKSSDKAGKADGGDSGKKADSGTSSSPDTASSDTSSSAAKTEKPSKTGESAQA